MDKVMWVIIAAAVVIALAGIILYIGGDSLGNFDNKTEDTSTSQLCSFEESEVEAGRLSCDEITPRCESEISRCS